MIFVASANQFTVFKKVLPIKSCVLETVGKRIGTFLGTVPNQDDCLRTAKGGELFISEVKFNSEMKTRIGSDRKGLPDLFLSLRKRCCGEYRAVGRALNTLDKLS